MFTNEAVVQFLMVADETIIKPLAFFQKLWFFRQRPEGDNVEQRSVATHDVTLQQRIVEAESATLGELLNFEPAQIGVC